MKRFALYLTSNLLISIGMCQGIIIDHTCTDISQIPTSVINDVKSQIKLHYCGQSHSWQISSHDEPNCCGLAEVKAVNPTLYKYEIGQWELPNTPNTLCIYPFCGNYTYVSEAVYLDQDNLDQTLSGEPTLNVSQFQWCYQLDTWTQAQVQSYLNTMSNYEQEYPDVTFIYTTGNSLATGASGYNRHLRNQQIRNYCIANNKVLFDFGDIECWYNDQQSTYTYNGQQIPVQQSIYNGDNCDYHVNELCSVIKAKAEWWLLARVVGWNPSLVNNPPVIADQTFSTNENSANGTLIGNVIATDPDAGQTLTYSIVSGNTSNAFQINSSTGALSVNNTAALNFEVTPSFGLVIKVQDNGAGSLFAQATVTVNLTNVNENPNISNQAFSIAENSPNGQQVGIVVATDPDAGQTLTYSIVSGNTSNAFQINASTGTLSVNNTAALNFEATPSYGLVIKVQDNGQGNLFAQATITINLTDVNEIPNISNQTFSVPESSQNGTQVGVVIATDPDNGQSLTYSILSGNTDNAFAINGTTGALTVANNNALNSTSLFSLIVKVTDNGPGNLFSQATMTINVTEDVNQPPQISNQTFSIAENSPNGQQVGVVVATDPDAGQILTYSIISGNTNNAFQINASTGALTVSNSSALNYEVVNSFGLTVKAQDNGQGNLYSQATVTVNLTDVNENPNISNQSFSIDEFSANGTEVGTLVATDPDNGQNLTFSILSGNDNNAFLLNPATGLLTVWNSSALNFETNPVFNLEVEVTDNGTGNLSDQALIIVNLNELIIGFEEIPGIVTCRLYPNPANEYIDLSLENLSDEFEISILNLKGELQWYEKLNSENGMLTKRLDIEGLSKGIYIMKINTGTSFFQEKFIKL
jgi:hypothetical protein